MKLLNIPLICSLRELKPYHTAFSDSPNLAMYTCLMQVLRTIKTNHSSRNCSKDSLYCIDSRCSGNSRLGVLKGNPISGGGLTLL